MQKNSDPQKGSALFSSVARKAYFLRVFCLGQAEVTRLVYMAKVNKILAPTDLSEVSAVGIRYALDVARTRGAEVIVYNVIDVGRDWIVGCDDFTSACEMFAQQKRTLNRFLRERFADQINVVEVRQVIEVGAVASNIVEKAKSEGVDMIIMATHGQSGLHHLLMIGSVSEQVVSRAPCPVLVIPARERTDYAQGCHSWSDRQRPVS